MGVVQGHDHQDVQRPQEGGRPRLSKRYKGEPFAAKPSRTTKHPSKPQEDETRRRTRTHTHTRTCTQYTHPHARGHTIWVKPVCGRERASGECMWFVLTIARVQAL